MRSSRYTRLQLLLLRRRKKAIKRTLDMTNVARAYVGVTLGRLHVAVAEQLLDVTDVGSRFEQMRREGVP